MRFYLALHWHPEMLAASHPSHLAIFKWLDCSGRANQISHCSLTRNEVADGPPRFIVTRSEAS